VERDDVAALCGGLGGETVDGGEVEGFVAGRVFELDGGDSEV